MKAAATDSSSMLSNYKCTTLAQANKPSITDVSKGPASGSQSSAAAPLLVQGSIPVANKSTNSSIDILMMNSPLRVKRTLHQHDDTVITTSSNYEKSIMKKIHPKQ